jgi:hypothetical protein
VEASGIKVTSQGIPPGLGDLLHERVEAAAHALDLERYLSEVRLLLDDLPGDGEAWYGIENRPEDPRPRLLLYCHRDSLTRGNPGQGVGYPTREVWEQAPAPREEFPTSWDPEDLDGATAFVTHHLLTAGDILRGEVRGSDLPHGLAEAFTASWAVVVDGRLDRAGLPGIGLRERRSRFSRLFAAAGILMPNHWQIFQALWDGALDTQKDVLAVVRQLPRL